MEWGYYPILNQVRYSPTILENVISLQISLYLEGFLSNTSFDSLNYGFAIQNLYCFQILDPKYTIFRVRVSICTKSWRKRQKREKFFRVVGE